MKPILKVVAYTGGISWPSARYRVRQHISFLAAEQIIIEECWLPWGFAMPINPLLKPLWIGATAGARILSVPGSYQADITLLQRQILPAFIPLEGFTKRPRILDVDDAIWLNRGGKRAKTVAANCTAIMCGNPFLANYFRQWNKNVYIIPTAVDTDAIRPTLERGISRQVIGWTGSKENLKYLYQIEPALREVLASNRGTELLIVSNQAPQFERIPSNRVRFVRWSPEAELAALAEMTVGIMPLEDSEWARGKCSFKMLCYMAAGKPVVVSEIGMNRDVLRLGVIGTGAATSDEWIAALNTILRDRDLALRMGECGRLVAIEHFSVQAVGPLIANVFRSAAATTT